MNKRYSKEEYEKLRGEIVVHMNKIPYRDKNGRIYAYGEFFPADLSPFAYNETIADNFFPLSREEAEKKGYKYKEVEARRRDITLKTEDIPDHVKDAPDSILNEVVQCARCRSGFKIIPMELEFLRKRNLPLPRECPLCRIREKFSQWVKDLRLIPRVCDLCGADFETGYAEAEAPVAYCQRCFQKEFV